MLPSRPKAAGLPNGPRSRMAEHVLPRQGYADTSSGRSTPSSSRQYTQKSSSTAPRERSRSRSRPPPLRSKNTPTSRPYDTRSEAGDYYRKSDDSATSSGSSLFDRVKAAGAGYASSFTSFEDDTERDKGYKPSRGRRITASEPPSPTDPKSSSGWAGDGAALWNRMASAASELTISVSKAWASNIPTFSGEETPPGQESRLTRAMKAYHRDKARSPEDLPSWLFDESERRATPPSWSQPRSSQSAEDEYDMVEAPVNETRKPRGLRDVYAAASQSSQIRAEVAPRYETTPSRATDRLKALRDAKRSAVSGVTASEPEEATRREIPRALQVGLPAGPKSRNRI